MHILWTYLRPHWRLAALALLLATASQVLALVDPIIFGNIVDEYAIHRAGKTEDELISACCACLGWRCWSRCCRALAKALQEYVTRLVVQKLGTRMFNDGLRQLLRLKFQEFEDLRSGETLSLLQKVRADSERFINAFINTLFASLVGVSFLVWYCGHQALAAGAGVPGRRAGDGRAHRPAEPRDQEPAALDHARDEPQFRLHHRVAAQYRTDQEPRPDLPRNPPPAGADRSHLRARDERR